MLCNGFVFLKKLNGVPNTLSGHLSLLSALVISFELFEEELFSSELANFTLLTCWAFFLKFNESEEETEDESLDKSVTFCSTELKRAGFNKFISVGGIVRNDELLRLVLTAKSVNELFSFMVSDLRRLVTIWAASTVSSGLLFSCLRKSSPSLQQLLKCWNSLPWGTYSMSRNMVVSVSKYLSRRHMNGTWPASGTMQLAVTFGLHDFCKRFNNWMFTIII